MAKLVGNTHVRNPRIETNESSATLLGGAGGRRSRRTSSTPSFGVGDPPGADFGEEIKEGETTASGGRHPHDSVRAHFGMAGGAPGQAVWIDSQGVLGATEAKSLWHLHHYRCITLELRRLHLAGGCRVWLVFRTNLSGGHREVQHCYRRGKVQALPENLALLIAVRLCQHVWVAERLAVCLKSDSTATVGSWAKEWSTNANINAVVRPMSLDLAEGKYTVDRLEHLPGKLNEAAELLSRLAQPGTTAVVPQFIRQASRHFPGVRENKWWRVAARPSETIGSSALEDAGLGEG